MFRKIGIVFGEKKILIAFPILTASIFLSGCSLNPSAVLPVKNEMANATVLKTEDGGGTWNSKVKIDDKKTIEGIDVLSMAISPADAKVIYLGTASNGLFQTIDGGETWKNVAFPDKVYGLVFDQADPAVMYGSGIFNGRAKIFKRIGEDQEWKETYTEPADGTTIASLAIDPKNHQIIYAGTNEGVIVKSTDAGTTWVNIKKAEGPVTSIAFDTASSAHVFFGIFETGILETTDGGINIVDISEKIDPAERTTTVNTVVSDPYLAGVVYAATDRGIFKRSGDGNWTALNLIESSKAFPIRAIAINPKNSKEITYVSSRAIYKSIDGGTKWSTFQLDTSKDVSVLKYVNANPSTIYAGMRSY